MQLGGIFVERGVEAIARLSCKRITHVCHTEYGDEATIGGRTRNYWVAHMLLRLIPADAGDMDRKNAVRFEIPNRTFEYSAWNMMNSRWIIYSLATQDAALHPLVLPGKGHPFKIMHGRR